jgi:hypothetical protein
MITVKALVSNLTYSKPRSGPTVTTQVDYADIAFAQLLQWESTAKTSQNLSSVTVDKLAAGGVFILALWLVRPEDSANVSRKFSPFNVLLVTEGIEDTLKALQDQGMYKVNLKSETLNPPNFTTQGLLLDGKRARITIGDSADGWVNVKTVTEAQPPIDRQELVIKNYHPIPLPSLEYRFYVASDERLYKLIHGEPVVDYAGTFPPDDGSGDWFYMALTASLDMPRRYAALGTKYTDLGPNPNPGLLLSLVRQNAPRPAQTKWIEVAQGVTGSVTPDMWGINAPGVTPGNFLKTRFVPDVASPGAAFLPPDNTNADKGFGIWDDAYVNTLNQLRSNPLYGLDAAFARLPMLVANCYTKGFNHTDDWMSYEQRWREAAQYSGKLGELGYKFPIDNPDRSELLHTIFRYMGSDVAKTVILVFRPITPADPKTGYTNILTQVYKMDLQPFREMLGVAPSSKYLPLYTMASVPFLLDANKVKPIVEFSFDTKEPQATYLDTFKKETNFNG